MAGTNDDDELDGLGKMNSVSDVAKALEVSESKIYELVRSCRIGHYRIDGTIRISRRHVVDYLDSLERGGRGEDECETIGEARPERPRLRRLKI